MFNYFPRLWDCTCLSCRCWHKLLQKKSPAFWNSSPCVSTLAVCATVLFKQNGHYSLKLPLHSPISDCWMVSPFFEFSHHFCYLIQNLHPLPGEIGLEQPLLTDEPFFYFNHPFKIPFGFFFSSSHLLMTWHPLRTLSLRCLLTLSLFRDRDGKAPPCMSQPQTKHTPPVLTHQCSSYL